MIAPLQVKKLGLREVKYYAYGYTAREWQVMDLIPIAKA